EHDTDGLLAVAQRRIVEPDRLAPVESAAHILVLVQRADPDGAFPVLQFAFRTAHFMLLARRVGGTGVHAIENPSGDPSKITAHSRISMAWRQPGQGFCGISNRYPPRSRRFAK